MKTVLDGIRVLDLSQFFSGPWCGLLLADMGAEVIKIEPPIVGDYLRVGTMFEKGLAPLFTVFNRNKKSITLNLKRSEKAREIFKKLVLKSDIIIDNSLPGDMEELGLGYEDLKKMNPKLIYAAISGFGCSGPYKERPAFDIIAQATGGILDALKMYEAPKIPFADINAGGYCALGILEALFYREKTGKGQFIDISMQEIMYTYNILAHVSQTLKTELDQSFSRILPSYNVFETVDGRVALVILTEKQWVRMCEAMEKPELIRDKRYNNPLKRWKKSAEVDEIIKNWTKTKKTDEIIKILDNARIPCGPVIKYDEVINHPQLIERKMIAEFDIPEVNKKIKLPNVLIKLSESPGTIQSGAPILGTHTEEILSKILEFTDQEVSQLKKEGVI